VLFKKELRSFSLASYGENFKQNLKKTVTKVITT
jgi:hypothetical protein